MSAEDARALFARRFGTEPVAIASAPGRVNLIGEHTDYNGGEVLPIAIAARTTVAVGPAVQRETSVVVSAGQPDSGAFDARAPAPAGAWWDYVAGVVAELGAWGIELPQLRIAITSDVPTGAGLSSSAALEIAAPTALLALAGVRRSADEVALLGTRVERAFVGVATGIMDQFASALGREQHALHLWCDPIRHELVPMRESVLIFDTGVARELRDSAFNQRRAECDAALAILRRSDPALRTLAAATRELLRAVPLPPPLDRRARHVVSEMERVRRTVEHLGAHGTLDGPLLYASHESLRDDYECSTAELDWFVERAARVPGITGARLTGAGWGGSAIAVGAEQALRDAAPALAREYALGFSRTPRVWITGAAAGARLEQTAV